MFLYVSFQQQQLKQQMQQKQKQQQHISTQNGTQITTGY